jgi:protein TonB
MASTMSTLSSEFSIGPALLQPPSDLGPGQRRALVAAVIALHGLIAWAVFTHSAPTEVLAEPPAIEVSRIQDAPDVAPPPAPYTPVQQVTPPKAQPKSQPVPTPPKAAPVLASTAAADTPPPMVVPPTPAPQPTAPVPVKDAAPPTPAPAPAASSPVVKASSEAARPPMAPKVLPSSAVRYLVEPVLVYPRISSELGESGEVQLKVLVDEQGRPKDIVLVRSSGFPRLDRQAIQAMKGARFQPYVEEGTTHAVWAQAKLVFNLEDSAP